MSRRVALARLLVGALLAPSAACRRASTAAAPAAPAATEIRGRSSVAAMLDPERDKLLRPDALVARLAVPVGGTVADLGAGPGYLTLRLARAVGERGRVVATDVDGVALAALSARAKEAGVDNVEARAVAADDPGLAPRSIDLALLCHVAAFLPDRAAWLARLAPSLRPGGRLAVVDYATERAPLVEAAGRAGWRITDEAVGLLPMQFLLFLEPTR